MASNKAKKLFASAVALIESPSIREWAQSPRNLPIFLKISEGFVCRRASALSLSTFITAQAIGL